MVAILVDLVEDPGEILLGLFPCFLDSMNLILCYCELGSSMLQLKPKGSLSVFHAYGSLNGL